MDNPIAIERSIRNNTLLSIEDKTMQLAMLASSIGNNEAAYELLLSLKGSSVALLPLAIIGDGLGKDPVPHLNLIRASDAEELYTIASIYYKHGKVFEAIESLEKIEAYFPEIGVTLAKYYLDCGKQQAAIDTLTEVCTRTAEHIPSIVNLFNLIPFCSTIVSIEKLEEYVGMLAVPKESRLALHILLYKIYIKEGELDKAFQHFNKYLEGKEAEHGTAGISDLALDIPKKYTKPLIEKTEKPDTSNPMIFICGMPRSGTTLTESILCAHPQIDTVGETMSIADGILEIVHRLAQNTDLPDKQYQLGEQLLQGYGSIPNRLIDKMPHNFLYLGAIYQIMPNAKVIYLKRDPLDNCLSCLETLFAEGHGYSYNQTTMGEYYIAHEKIMQHWLNILPKEFLLRVSYEDLVLNNAREMKRIMEFIGLPIDIAQSTYFSTERIIKTASVSQANKPIYTSSVGRAHKLKEHLVELEEALNEKRRNISGVPYSGAV